MTIPTIGDGLVGYDGAVDPRGMITLLNQIRDALNCPSFRVDRNGVNQAGIVTATITAIQFNNIVFDTDKGWNSTSFLYQPTVPGVYLFGVQCHFNASVAGSATNALIVKNATAINNVRILATGIIGPTAEAVGLTTMDGRSDTITFSCFQDTGVNQVLSGIVSDTNAWGYRLPG